MRQSKTAEHPEIIEAIEQERCLIFFYKDLLRIVEPHCYGISKDGKYLLRAFQIGGKSSSSPVPGWRLFRVDEMESTTLTELKFLEKRSDFNPNDPAMSEIISRIRQG